MAQLRSPGYFPSSFQNLSKSSPARSKRPSFKTFISCYSSLFVFSLLCLSPLVNGQAFLNNGQFFTKGLAINDAPAPGSPQHAGSNLVIAIDLSGDGKVPSSAFIPGSGASTRYDALELYLVSSQTNSNFTVSNGTGLLTQEPDSTVKHLNWPIPSCVLPGTYNLTYYESSHINNAAFFSITSLNVTIDNPNRSGNTSQCNIISNQLQVQPQADSAPALNPDLNSPSGVATSSLAGSPPPTITMGTAGFPTAWTIESSGFSVTSATEPITTATIVVVSTATLTESVPGQNSVFTKTDLITTTVTAVMATSAVTAGGFFPVNGAICAMQPVSLIFIVLAICASTIFLAH